MSIKRMLLLASMALAAIAFAAPAVAQANITLTDEDGTKVNNNAKFTATSTNLHTKTEAGLLTCGHVALDLEVLDEGPEHLAVDDYNEATTEKCSLDTEAPEPFPATISNGTIDELTLNTWGHGTANATFTSTIFADAGHTMPVAHCHFHGPVTVQATTNNKLDVHGMLKKTEGEETCPSETGTITGEFDLQTHGGEPITINFNHTDTEE